MSGRTWREGEVAWVEISHRPSAVEITDVDGDQVSYLYNGRRGSTTAERLYRTEADYWDARALEYEQLAADYRVKAFGLRGSKRATAGSSALMAALLVRFVVSVRRMRTAQHEYFTRGRHRDLLIKAKQEEGTVDQLLRDLEGMA